MLQSGLKLALFIGHIMEPDLNWFKAQEGTSGTRSKTRQGGKIPTGWFLLTRALP